MPTIKGTVKNQSDNALVSGVEVELSFWFNEAVRNLKVATDAFGGFFVAFDASLLNAQKLPMRVLASVTRNGKEEIPVVNVEVIARLELKDCEIEVLVNLPTIVTPPVTPGRFSVEGRVTDASGVAVSHVTVTAFDRDMRREELLGSATTDADGKYQISYSSAQFTRAEKDRADLVVRVIGPDGKTELTKSDTLFNAPASAEVNLTISADKLHLGSEWERYHRELAPIIENVPISDLTDEDLQFLTSETGIDPTHLRLVRLDALWRDQQAQLKLPAAAFYGLLRQGLPTDWTPLLQSGPVRWRAALKQAVADRQVPTTVGQISEAFVAQLTELAIDQSFVSPSDGSSTEPRIGLLLAGSTVSVELQRQIAGVMLNHSPNQDPQQLWDSLAQAGLPDGAVRSTRFVLEAQGLVHQHLPTLAVLQASHARAFGAGADLARLSRVQWLEVAQTVANTGTKSFPKGFDNAEVYAESLADRVELTYPTAVVAHRLVEDTEPARREVGKFLVQNPAFDLLTTPVEAFLKTAKLEKIDTEALTKQLGKEVRLAKLAPATNRAVYMQALQANGFDSTAKVMMAGKLEFTRRMEHIAGPAAAKEMYFNAKQRAAEVALHTLKLREALEHWSPVLPSAAVAPGSRLATWADLFGRGDGCFCPPCDSVHGPAAYLMDLFEFLKEMDAKAPAGGQSLLDVLSARRPDLQHLKLNCANAETPLPYIDLVNELLERQILDIRDTPQTPEALDATDDVAARLHALPEENAEIASAVYDGHLKTAVYPWQLPFDRGFLQAGLYLKLIGISPVEVLELMAKPGDRLHQARLGLSLSLWDRVTRASTAAAEAWGLRGENLDQLVNFAGDNGVLLARSGLAVDELFALIESPLFAGWNLHIDRTSDPCDITHTRLMQRIGGDEATPVLGVLSEVVRTEVFDLMHRLLRLRLALDWPMAKLQPALQALRIGRFRSAIDLVALSRMVSLSAQRGVPIERVAASLLALDQAPVGSAELAHAQADWLALLKLSAVDHAHLLALGLEDSLERQEPGQRLERTADALETVALLTAASVDPAELRYLLRHQDLVPAVFMPRENDLEAQLDSVVAAIQNAGVEPLTDLPALPADASEERRSQRRAEEARRVAAQETVLLELAPLLLAAAGERLREITGVTFINSVIADASTGALLAVTGTDRTRGVVHDFIALAALATDNSGYVGLRAAANLSLRRVLKTARLLVILKTTAADAEAMTQLTRDNTLWLDFNTLPVVPVTETASRPNLSTLKGLLQTSVTQSAMPQADRRLLQVIAAATDAATTVADLERITGWGRSVSIPPSAGAWALGGVANELEIAVVGDTLNWRSPDTYARLQTAIRWLQGHRMTVSSELIPPLNLLISAASGVTVDGLKALARSRFATNADWYKALTPAMDHLRAQQRDALLAHILNTNRHGWKTADDVYEHLLIDVQMGPCQLSSRIVQAHSAVQLFVQRCLMNLEKPEEVALGDVSDITEWRQWDWMKNYRVWEAGRKVFLYPENWIEPDLRDVKSPFFEELENELLQDEITPDMVERTVRTYLTKLHEVARLDIRALYEDTYQERSGDGKDVTRKVIHMVGRTHAVPHIHYYRQRLDDLSWTPWEKIDLSIAADHLVLAVQNRRPMLIWPQWHDVATDRNDPPGRAWDMAIQVSVQEFGHWSAPNRSQSSVRISVGARASTTLRPRLVDGRLEILIYQFESLVRSSLGVQLAFFAFSVDDCTGAISVFSLPTPVVRLLPPAVKPVNQALVESVANDSSQTFLRVGPRGEPERNVSGDVGGVIELLSGGLGGLIVLAFTVPHNSDIWPQLDAALREAAPAQMLLRTNTEGFRLVPCQQYPQFNASQPYVLQHGDRQLLAIRKFPPDSLIVSGGLFSAFFFPQRYVLEHGEHPLACDLLSAVRADGLNGIYRPAEVVPTRPGRYPRQLTPDAENWVRTRLDPNPVLVWEQPSPVDEFDFSPQGAYGLYNWEVFFHIPLLLADRLSKNGRFEDAQRWFHTIFDPTDVSPHPAPQKYWRVKPLFAECESRSAPEASRTLEDMMRRLSMGDADLEQPVEAWRNDPFNPHLIARMRLVAYMKTVVQKYIENLTAWADSLFRRDTMESINEATQLYVLGNHILGGAPVVLPPMQREARSYAVLISEHSVDAFANVLVDIDTSLPLSAARLSRSERPAAGVSMLYFCIPSNARLSELRTTIADRLFKIRHCMDIEGRTRQLALFAPPIDPALLVRARAAGLDIGTALSMALGASTPHYRFQPLLQKALEFCNEVRSFGNALLSALEKRDGEVLAQLHSRHEVGMLKRVSEIKRQQVEEAEANLEATRKSKAVVQARLDFYHANLTQGRSPAELGQIDQLHQAHGFEILSASHSALASIFHALPTAVIGFPCNGTEWGGPNLGHATQAAGSVFGLIAQQWAFEASMSGYNATYTRRDEEWHHQIELATRELAQIDQQIIAGEIRLAIAEQEQRNHEQQIADAEEVFAMQRDKFTNAQLYSWMSAQLAALHYQSYRMAFDLAKQAEAAADYELETGTLIRFDHWDAGRKGLLAGERLAQDLRRLETAYLDRNTRELEITKHVSLRQLNPLALMELRAKGQCTFHIPEALFDLDFPGHYFRRIKSVSMSVPCVAGPYTSVSGTLTLEESWVRKQPRTEVEKVPLRGSLQSIATSSGQNDGGLFELNFRDERYLPFEGRGAESTWQFSLPTDFKAFDYDTIADLVLHIRYTAREGGDGYSRIVASGLVAALNTVPTDGLKLLVSLRHDFPAEWRALQAEGDDAPPREIRIDASLFPYFVRGNFSISAVRTMTNDRPSADQPLFSGSATTATVNISSSMKYLLVSYSMLAPVRRSIGP